MASFSIAIDVALRFLDEPPLRDGIRNFSFTMPVAASRSSVSPSESSSNDDMSTFLKYALVAALRMLLPIYKDIGNLGQCPRHRQLRPKLRRPVNICSWANGRTGCGQRAAMCPEYLACAPLLTAGTGKAAG
jgi:hypothetical protein